jgi:asparagine N-glycosylation enzyme membrane subunit Stt3
VPLCGALTIWLTFTLGRQLFEPPAVALWGAALVATSRSFCIS